MNNVVYISSLGHSGSTMLDLILGGHSKFIGLGEVAVIIKPGEIQKRHAEGRLCSCGQLIADCAFWGKVAEEFAGNADSSFSNRYKTVLRVFAEDYGQDIIPVDSSKYLPTLEKIIDNNIEIKTISLARDVRSFAISQIDNVRKKQYSPVKGNAFYQFIQWYRENTLADKLLRRAGTPNFRIGYEEICLAPDSVLAKLCEFLAVEYEPGMKSIKESESHIAVGNRMRWPSSNKREGITYDHRWFCRNEWLVPSIVFPFIMKYNTSRVYSNHQADFWKR